MFKKIFEYAGPYKKNMYAATVVVLVSVLMGVLPFVLAYKVISPLVMCGWQYLSTRSISTPATG